MTSFTPEERARLKSELLDLAARDSRLSGAAVTGSAAIGKEDQWSDIDLAFGVADVTAVPAVLADFSDFMYTRGALHHHDVRAGAWIYRVFFLPGGLQADLAFVPKGEFRPLGPAFQLVFGTAQSLQPFPAPNAKDLISMAWLHALHARTSILREKSWQAEYMISAVRDYVFALALIRRGLPSAHGRSIHLLPEDITRPLAPSLVRSLETNELWRAFGVVIQNLNREINHADPAFGLKVSAEIAALADRPAS